MVDTEAEFRRQPNTSLGGMCGAGLCYTRSMEGPESLRDIVVLQKAYHLGVVPTQPLPHGASDYAKHDDDLIVSRNTLGRLRINVSALSAVLPISNSGTFLGPSAGERVLQEPARGLYIPSHCKLGISLGCLNSIKPGNRF